MRLRKAKREISLFKLKTTTFKKVCKLSKVSQAVNKTKRAPKLTLKRRTTTSSNQKRRQVIKRDLLSKPTRITTPLRTKSRPKVTPMARSLSNK